MGEAELTERVEYNPKYHLTEAEVSDIADQEGLDRSKIPRLPWVGSKTGERVLKRLDLGPAFHEYPESPKGLTLDRYFTKEGENPFDTVGPYEHREITIHSEERIDRMKVYVPETWTDGSANIVGSKYLLKPDKDAWKEKIPAGSKFYEDREDWKEAMPAGIESSPIQLFSRVSHFFAEWGQKLGYFSTPEQARIFEEELNFLQINQMASFNSPVYFNAGIHETYGIGGSNKTNFYIDPETKEIVENVAGEWVRPQLHACFISTPGDDLEEILEHYWTEGKVFERGSGIGGNVELRERGAPLAGGGVSSGALSFYKQFDRSAGIIKSGGKTRRAARMTTIDEQHPDVMDFVRFKRGEDKKALILTQQGYDGSMDGEAWSTVAGQNTNYSIRISRDTFGKAESGGNVQLVSVKTGEVVDEISAERMLQEIAFGAWRIGDPGIQYKDKIQEGNTCPNSGTIDSSNPCSEYMWFNDTSCNLASLNLLRFSDKEGNLDVDKLKMAARVIYFAQDIANYAASYPTEKIARLSPQFGTTGLGYSNLGALIMRKGLSYDSDEARALTGAVTAVVAGQAAKTSTELADGMGTFLHYEVNKKPFLNVMSGNQAAVDNIAWDLVGDAGLKDAAYTLWEEVITLGEEHGFRNAQHTVLAPTGTTAFAMGCDTTGIEPAPGLTITKSLAGGGSLELTVNEVPNALKNLGYEPDHIEQIGKYIARKKTVVGAPHLSPDHYPVFDTAFSPTNEGRTLALESHLRMVAAAQPFISGAISKTMNAPEGTTVKEIYDAFMLGNDIGLKAITVFRDKGKPISVLKYEERKERDPSFLRRGEKRPTPIKADPITGGSYCTHFRILDSPKIHVNVKEYEDGTPAEVFINALYEKKSAMHLLLAEKGVSISRQLQYGRPLEKIVGDLARESFEPSGFVDHPEIKEAKSISAVIGRWLGLHYLGKLEYANMNVDADMEEFIKGLRGFHNGAFETNAMGKIDQWDVDQVLENPKLGGFKEEQDPIMKLLEESDENGKGKKSDTSSGKMCTCGTAMIRTAPSCYQCPNPDCNHYEGSCGG
jgi:ribonucleoside-diphosphate reductase alpha chain